MSLRSWDPDFSHFGYILTSETAELNIDSWYQFAFHTHPASVGTAAYGFRDFPVHHDVISYDSVSY